MNIKNFYSSGKTASKYLQWVDTGLLKDWQNDFDILLSWFLNESDPINFGLFYINEPDETLHYSDIYSEKVDEKLKELDNLTKYIVDRLNHFQLSNEINLIFTADHGH